jgi:hypothetical protein
MTTNRNTVISSSTLATTTMDTIANDDELK